MVHDRKNQEGFERDSWGSFDASGLLPAVAAVEEIKQARGSDKLTKIKQNLADLRAAKEEAISEKNLQEGQMLNRQDIEEYVTEWPQSVVGETYEVGIVGQPPYATAPVDLGDYRAGSKIEPFRSQNSGVQAFRSSGVRMSRHRPFQFFLYNQPLESPGIVSR